MGHGTLLSCLDLRIGTDQQQRQVQDCTRDFPSAVPRRIYGPSFLSMYPQNESQISVQIRAANSLLSIVHSMKLQLLLSDEAQIVERRDAELATTLQEKEEAKAKVAELLSELLK
jgi:hypothetical protein